MSREPRHDPVKSTIATLLHHSCQVIDRKDEVIAALNAQLDQADASLKSMRAANDAMHRVNARITRENTTLRAELREARR